MTPVTKWPAWALATLLLAVLCTQQPAKAELRQDDTAVVIAAVVNDDVITEYDVIARMRLVMLSARIPDTPENRERLVPQVLRSLIDERVQIQEAQRLEISVEKDELEAAIRRIEEGAELGEGGLEQMLEDNGIPDDAVLNQIRANLAWLKIIGETVRPLIQIGEDEIDERLESMKSQRGRPENLVSEIFLPVTLPRDEEPAKQAAEEIISQVRRGVPFEELARQFSQGATAATGGDIGWVRQGYYEPELDEVLESMSLNTVSEPIRTGKGYHILQLRDRRVSIPDETDATVVSLKQIVWQLKDLATADEIAGRVASARSVRKEIYDCPTMDLAIERLDNPLSGDLGQMRVGDLPQKLREAVIDLEVGQISEPIVTDQSVLLLMACQRDEADSVMPDRDEIAESISRQRLDLLARDYLRDLRQSAFLDVRV